MYKIINEYKKIILYIHVIEVNRLYLTRQGNILKHDLNWFKLFENIITYYNQDRMAYGKPQTNGNPYIDS